LFVVRDYTALHLLCDITLSRQSNPSGNICDSLSRNLPGTGQKEYFLSHDRYILSRQSNPLGNLYGFLSQNLAGRGGKDNFLSHDRYFLSRQSNPLEISMISFPSGLPEEAEKNISKAFCANLPGIGVIMIKL